MWTQYLPAIQSLGSQTPVIGGLAGCAAARATHVGQFFTPPEVVSLLWHLLGEAMHADPKRSRINLIDTSCGIGRMFGPADPGIHHLFGADIDGVCTQALGTAVAAADFHSEIRRCPLEELSVVGMDVALLNPPFSIAFDSPALIKVPGTHRGRYGQHSAAISQWYAVGHALEAAPIVGAVLPWSMVASILDGTAAVEFTESLVRVVRVPRGAFATEGAEVDTAVVIFERHARRSVPVVVDVADPADAATWPAPYQWTSRVPRGSGFPRVRRTELDDIRPLITRSVTGDTRVRLVKAGRRIGLRFHCGFTEAVVLNRVLVDRMAGRVRGDSPIPRGVVYTGQGKLDIEVHLAQSDPVQSLAELVAEIQRAGGEPSMCASLAGYVRRAARRAAVRRIPMKQVAYIPGAEHAQAWLAGRDQATLVMTCPWVSRDELLAAGTRVEAQRVLSDAPTRSELDDPTFQVMQGERAFQAPMSSWLRLATAEGVPDAGWSVVHPGLKAAVPHLVAASEARCRAAGIDRLLSWGYQWDDLQEFLVRGNSICAWKPGLGKSRLAIALCLMGGRRNLIVVEARLVNEMVRELVGLDLPAGTWQVIETPGQARRLARINVIAYSRLRQAIGGRAEESPATEGHTEEGATPRLSRSRCTIARMLRHRIHTLISDEAHCLRNLKSQQTRALWQLAPKRIYDLSGTPIASYPRDVLPLLAHAGGDGSAEQPYGIHHPYLESIHRQSMCRAVRGIDQFAEKFVTFEWVTNEFLDDLQSGAKREIPRIADVSGFRAAVTPHIKRRVEREPDVAAHITYPVPVSAVTTVAWDQDHLDHYIATVDDFASWYERMKAGDRSAGDKRNNLAMILQKIGAVVQACNNPHEQEGPSRYRGDLTSKQREVLSWIGDQVAEGHKVLVFAGSPLVLNRLKTSLDASDIGSVLFHGGVPIARRVQEMSERFRDGDVPVLLGSRRCLQQGYNLYQADRACFYDRAWLATEEEQALARMLRPQQKSQVLAQFFHLEGSIDEYQAQMVGFKSAAMAAGLDYGDPAGCEGDFLHLETILARFLDDFGARYGYAGRRRKIA